MTKTSMDLSERLAKHEQGDFLHTLAEAVLHQALVVVIQEAWIGRVSTRRVDDLVQAMGLSGISKSTGSKLCKE